MKKYLVISIDVEPDCSPSWQYSKPLSFQGMEIGIGERLQPLFNKYDAKPTYLLNNVVMEDKESVQVLKNLSGKFELGTHLHPEFIAPEKQYFDYAGKNARANCCQYSPKVEFEKLENITKLFEQNFGYRPTAFRAGRWAAGSNTIESLIKLGYKADTSVAPHQRWVDKGNKPRVDFREAPEQPYFIDEHSLIKENPNGPLLQIPVSIVPPKFSMLQAIRRCIQKRKLSKLPAVWLRPSYTNIKSFKEDKKNFEWVINYISKKYASNPYIVYNVMFHNVEVLPNLSPYTRNEEECSQYLQSLEWLLAYCKKENIEVVGMSDLYHIYRGEDNRQKVKILFPKSLEKVAK